MPSLGSDRNSWARRGLVALSVAILVFGVLRAVQRSWVTDDIYITFRYCDNVLAGHGPVYNVGERTEGYTHFLWFVLLTVCRMLSIDPLAVGRYAGIPAYAGCLVLLVRISGRLFPGRDGVAGVSAAALAWALHEDAQLWASGGLETPLFTFWLLLGFHFLCISEHPRRVPLAGWSYAMASLTRPEGMLFSVVAGAYLIGRRGRNWRNVSEFALLWLLLYAPLEVFRLLFYGYPFPNTYYAKAGALAHWSQGWRYLSTYFSVYFGLMAAAIAAWLIGRDLRPRDPGPPGPRSRASLPLAFAYVTSALFILYVVRLGGDYLYARLFIPISPFLLLLCESLLQRPRRLAWRLGGTAVLVGTILLAPVLKNRRLSDRRQWHEIADGRQIHGVDVAERFRSMAEMVKPCFSNIDATILVQGGQATLAYYSQFPTAIEVYGLTDARIAHMPLRQRGRPGHEKLIETSYIYERGVNFRFHYTNLRSAPLYSRFVLQGAVHTIHGQILVYDRELMEELKRCPRISFLDFPIWLQQQYIPMIATQHPRSLIQDFNDFQLYYFDHNPDPEGLLEVLRDALAQRGIHQIPRLALPEFEELGRVRR